MKKEIILGICIVAGAIVAAPVAAVSDSGADIPEDWYDETQDWFSGNAAGSFIEYSEGYGKINKPLGEQIKTPDEIMSLIKENMNYEKEVIEFTEISPTDFATWIAVASENEVYGEQPMIRSHLIPISTDTDPEPEELAAICFFPYSGFADLSPIENHLVGTGNVYDEDGNKMSGYLVNPFDIPKNPETYSNTQKLLYWENPEMVKPADKVIYWKNAVGKTPAELGLDKYDKPTAADRKAYEAKQDEKLYERLVEQGISEESAKKMVEDMRTDTAAKEDKTPGFVGTLGLGAIGMAAYLDGKYKNKGGAIKNESREMRDEKI